MLKKLNDLRAQKEEGFTLIELLVVIVIIGVLAAIALPIFLNQQKAAIKASVKSDVRNAVAAVSTMAVKNPTFPNLTGIITGTTTTSGVFSPTFTPANRRVPVSVSNPQTTVYFTGSWDDYSVTGTNPSMNESATTIWQYQFTSTTGKYIESED